MSNKRLINAAQNLIDFLQIEAHSSFKTWDGKRYVSRVQGNG